MCLRVCVCVLFQWWFIRIWKGWCSPVYWSAKTGRSPISFYPFLTDFSSLLNNGNGMGLRLRQCSAGAVKVWRRNALRGQVSAGGSLFSCQADWGICGKADNGKKTAIHYPSQAATGGTSCARVCLVHERSGWVQSYCFVMGRYDVRPHFH